MPLPRDEHDGVLAHCQSRWIEHGLLRTLLVDAWRLTAPRRLAATYPSVDAGDTTPGTAAVEAS
jgi:hypothetical protein